jgi:hypothetical protein
MAEDTKQLFDERLGRFQAAIALEPTDRVPIAPGSNYFSEIYSGNTNQETIYDPERWLKAELAFIKDFPEFDALRNNRLYAPIYDAVSLKTYQLPGRELPVRMQMQFLEAEYMLADEYDKFIANPIQFMFECWFPRIFGDFKEPGSIRSYVAMLKGGMAQMQVGQVMRNRGITLQTQCGMPQPQNGFFLAPFDVLADAMRGLHASLMDTYKRPQKVLAACDMLVDEMVNLALATADPFKRYPIFVPTHKAIFMSPQQFDKFYWPSFKKVCEKLIAAGHTVRAYLEGNWGPYWHHLLELPKGKVLCDIDNEGDIQKAKKEIGHHQCICGGVKDSQWILGTPQQMKDHVKHLIDTLAPGGGWIIGGGCNIPYGAKPENVRAMVDTVMEHGFYNKGCKPQPKAALPNQLDMTPFPKMVTPWAARKAELGGTIQGDEELIRKPWEQFEAMAYTWLWQWIQ